MVDDHSGRACAKPRLPGGLLFSGWVASEIDAREEIQTISWQGGARRGNDSFLVGHATKANSFESTRCEMLPHTNIVAAPASVAISHLYKNFIRLRLFGVACSTLHSPLPSRARLEQT